MGITCWSGCEVLLYNGGSPHFLGVSDFDVALNCIYTFHVGCQVKLYRLLQQTSFVCCLPRHKQGVSRHLFQKRGIYGLLSRRTWKLRSISWDTAYAQSSRDLEKRCQACYATARHFLTDAKALSAFTTLPEPLYPLKHPQYNSCAGPKLSVE